MTPLGRRGRGRILFAFETIRTVLGRRFFTLSTEEMILERAVLAAQLLEFGFELLGPMHGPSVHRFPIPDLLPQFGVLTPKAGNFLAQLENFSTKLLNQFVENSRHGGRERIDKRLRHGKNACIENEPGMIEGTGRKTGWAKVYPKTPLMSAEIS